MNSVFKKCIACAMLLLQTLVFAQSSSDTLTAGRSGYWGSLGLGLVGPGFGGLGKLTYGWGISDVSAKFEGGSNSDPLIGNVDRFLAASAFYGLHARTSQFMLRLAAGPGYFQHTTGVTFGFVDSTESIYRFGGSFEAEAMAVFGPVGLSLLGDIAVARDIFFPSVTFNLSFGRLPR